MLILTRRERESVIIESPAGERIEVCVAEIRGHSQIAVGVDAPKDHTVLRSELVKPKPAKDPAPQYQGQPPTVIRKPRR